MTDAAGQAPPPARDPGLQPERTRLAWTRTALAVALNAVLLVRSGLVVDQPAFIAVGGLLAIAAIAAIGFGVHRGRELARSAPAAPVHPWAVLAVVVVVLAAGVAGIASIIYAG